MSTRIVNEVMAGQYHSAFKGRGLAFEEVREYTPGDDVRNIDWNVTARMNRPYVKVHREERELTVCLCVDLSASVSTGSRHSLKRETMAEIAAVLAFSAVFNNDKVALVLFTDHVEEFVPPRKGSSHVWRVIRQVLTARPLGRGTSIATSLNHITGALRRGAVVFLISDFEDEDFESALAVASRKHDIIPVVIKDPIERELPPVGLLGIEDPESGEKLWVDASDPIVRRRVREGFDKRMAYLNDVFRSNGLDYTIVWNGEDYVKPLVNLFRIRERRVRVA